MVEVEFLPVFKDIIVKQRARDYLVDTIRYQRVTTALGIINKPALIPWARNMSLEAVREVLIDLDSSNPDADGVSLDVGQEGWVDWVIERARNRPEEVREKAAELGTAAHHWIDRLLKGTALDDLDIPEELMPAVAGATNFLLDHDIEVLYAEQTVWHPEVKVAGTFDGVGRLPDGRLVIWDWKRSRGIYWEYALQLSAYAACFTLMTGLDVDEAYVVKLAREPKDQPYEAKRVVDLDAGFEAYKAAVQLQRAGNKKWFAED